MTAGTRKGKGKGKGKGANGNKEGAPRKDQESRPAKSAGGATGQPGMRDTIGALWWCLTAGCLTFLAFPVRPAPESNIWPLAWICLVPLLYVLRDASPRRAFVYGLVMGSVTNFGGFWWICIVLNDFGHIPAPLAWGITGLNSAYQGLQFGIFGALLAVVSRKGEGAGIWVTAALYVGVEFCFPLIFPWYLGNSQYRFLPAVQIADVLGVAGVTFTIVLANAIALQVLMTKRLAPTTAAGLGWIVLVFAYGGLRLWMMDGAVAEAPHLRLGMVEANIGIFEKEAKGLSGREQTLTLHGNLLKHQRMSAELEEQGVDLVVWPESSYIPVGEVHAKRLSAFAMGVGPGGHLRLWRDHEGQPRSWTMGPETPTGSTLRALDACREDAGVIAGDDGMVLFWDGFALRRIPVRANRPEDETPDLYGVGIAGKGRPHLDRDGAPVHIWAVGEGGAVLYGDASGLSPIPGDTTETLHGVALINEQEAVAVGENGTLIHLAEGRSRAMASGTTEDLYGVWPDRVSGRVWAIGSSGVILRGNGKRWVTERPPGGKGLRAIAGSSPTRLWAAGDGGTILARQRDGKWRKEKLGTRADLLSLGVTPDGDVFAGDRDGGIWRRAHSATHDQSRWRKVEAPGIGPLRAIHGLPWVKARPIPRDARYIAPSEVPLPTEAAYTLEPDVEFANASTDRAAVQRGFQVPVIFGALTWKASPREGEPSLRFNTAVMLDSVGRVVGMYDKVFLLVFGEYIPLGDTFPFLYDWIPAAGRFTPGTDVQVFQWKGHRIGVLICYEDILPAFAADVVARDPEILVNITNDAWFGKTGEPYLHMALSVMRSVESRKTLVRSTNTGVSVIIDPMGRILHRTDLDRPETVVASVPLMKEQTLYGQVGDLFAHLALLWSTVAVVMSLRRRS